MMQLFILGLILISVSFAECMDDEKIFSQFDELLIESNNYDPEENSDLDNCELKNMIINIEGKEVVLRDSQGIEHYGLCIMEKIRKILYVPQSWGESYKIWDYFGHNFTDQYGFFDLNGKIVPLEFGNGLDMSKVQRVANYILYMPRESMVTKGWNLIGRRVYVKKVIPLPPFTPCAVLVNNNFILLQDPPLLKPGTFLLVGNDTIIHLSTDESEPLRAWNLSGKKKSLSGRKKRLPTIFKKSMQTELPYKLLNLSFSSKGN